MKTTKDFTVRSSDTHSTSQSNETGTLNTAELIGEDKRLRDCAEKLAEALKEVKFSLNACQLIITDATARETVRDLVSQANEALKAWEASK